jgi:hypothetical protein
MQAFEVQEDIPTLMEEREDHLNATPFLKPCSL